MLPQKIHFQNYFFKKYIFEIAFSKKIFSKSLLQKINLKIVFFKKNKSLPQKKHFRNCSLEMELSSPKNSYIFPKWNFCISVNGTPPKKLLIFQDRTFWAQKIKKLALKNVLIFQEMKLSNHKVKNNFYISGGNFQVLGLMYFFLFFKK